ncbi:hypothetical protein [Chryseobacterium sp. SL1]|uniref:hypothetical protein n=1 Tax=Chryseobacterium sp. SL1 TaxID=2995159 RepID=UPI0022743557|nr:hypothetical protein [Chryseobacterium sp. SL1]MCY1662848.1 hypothetical protein [Chryseobacterium sp. SL1]
MAQKNNNNLSINLILLFIIFAGLNMVGNSINGSLGSIFHILAFIIPAYLIVKISKGK